MSELTAALDAYAARVATLPGVDVVDRLLPGATDEELLAAEKWVGTSLPAELVEWFRWHNGVRVDEGRNFWSRMLLPLGEQLATWSREGRASERRDLLVREQSGVVNDAGIALSPDIGYPVLSGDVHFGWVECASGPNFGRFWTQTVDTTWMVTRFTSLCEYVERAVTFFDRGWVLPNGLGGVWIAPSLDGKCPPEMTAWAARQGLAGSDGWWHQAWFFMADPLSPGSPESIYNTWW